MMHRLLEIMFGVMVFSLIPSITVADLFNGNGNSGFGGTVGGGTLSITDDGTNLNFVFTRGGGVFNDALVLYLDSDAGGFTSTSGFTDNGDGLRTAISGNDVGPNQTVANFAAGFTADYAIALDVGFGGLWQLQNNASHVFQHSVSLSPTGNAGAASFTFSTSRSSIGLTTLETMKFVGTYISTTGFRSNETFGAITPTASNPGFNNSLTFTNFNTFTAVPEPSSMALLAIVGIGSGAWVRFRRSKKAADVPEIANEETVA